MAIVPRTEIPAGAAPAVDGDGGRRRVPGRGARRRAQVGAGRQLQGLHARRRRLRLVGRAGNGRQHVREGHPLGRRPLLLRARARRLPELRRQAVRVRRPLARRLGRAADRPARERDGDEHGHGVHVQARDLPVHGRPVGQQRQRRQRARAGRATPTTTRATRPGRCRSATRRASRSPRRRPGSATTARARTTPTTAAATTLEVKIPMAVLPAAVDPERMALNITPYDNDDTAPAAAGRCATSTRARGSPGRRSGACSPTRGCGAGRRCRATRRRPGARPSPRTRSWPRRSTAPTRRRRSTSRRATACRSRAGRRRPRATGSRRSTRRSRRPASTST